MSKQKHTKFVVRIYAYQRDEYCGWRCQIKIDRGGSHQTSEAWLEPIAVYATERGALAAGRRWCKRLGLEIAEDRR